MSPAHIGASTFHLRRLTLMCKDVALRKLWTFLAARPQRTYLHLPVLALSLDAALLADKLLPGLLPAPRLIAGPSMLFFRRSYWALQGNIKRMFSRGLDVLGGRRPRGKCGCRRLFTSYASHLVSAPSTLTVLSLGHTCG